jgi:hypothetical protein
MSAAEEARPWCSGHQAYLPIGLFTEKVGRYASIKKGHFCRACRRKINTDGYVRRKATGCCVTCRTEFYTESDSAICSKCRTQANYYDQQLRSDIVEAYGSKCQCPCGCNVTEPEFLALDHIFGGGGQERKKQSSHQLYRRLKKQGFPKDKHRLLCHNCNQARGIYGYCPLERER